MLHPSYQPTLVVLSLVVACLASYAALHLAGRIVAGGRRRMPWLLGSAFTMGVGIWSMHFVAMLAFHLDVRVAYRVDLVLLSVAVAIAASLLAFTIVSRPAPRFTTLATASLFMGAALAGMHYIGMASMQMPATIHYDRTLVTLSVAIAVTAALAALWLFVAFRDDRVSHPFWWKPASAVVMGAAISGMHYTGMLAADFVPMPRGAEPGLGVIASDALGYAVALAATFIAAVALAAALLDRSVRAKVAETRALRLGAEALRESQERLQFALAAAHMRTWELDLQRGVVIRTDVAASDRQTTRLEDLLARVHPDDRSAVDAALRRGADEGRFDVDFRLTTPAGEVRWFNAKGQRSGDDEASGVRFVGLSTDITDRRQLEEQFRQAQKMEAIGQLAGGIAHDFNNLLTVVKGNTELALQAMADTSAHRQGLLESLAATESAASLTRQLLAFSRRQLLQPRPLSLNDVVSELEPMLQRLIGEDVIITTRFDATPVVALADRGQLEQILMNLAVNARDAMPSGGTLRIETRDAAPPLPTVASRPIPPEPFVMLSISDTGVGIDPAIQARLFEPFFTTKGPSRGTGLGLSTVYGIVTQSGGHIFVDSEPGKGSTFTIYLRRAVLPPGEAIRARASEGAHAPPGSETILLAEDEDGVRTLVRRVLERRGYEVIEASGGAEALDLAERHGGRIDLLLTDVVMPGMGGRELSARLLEQRPDTRVLFMSGYTDDQTLRRGLFDPEVAFLAKPFSSQDLAAAVRAVLDPPGAP
jgi:NO-binding membrane sensor protein with MHYT domain/nitrogen-specific signal transduction histidine kinase